MYGESSGMLQKIEQLYEGDTTIANKKKKMKMIEQKQKYKN